MEDLSLHILDIAENSIEAGANNIDIYLKEDRKNDILVLEIKDDGKGMNKETIEKALDPFFSTKKVRRIGLGIPLLADAAKEAGGNISLDSEPGKWTMIRATFKLSHIDLKPLGDIASTLLTLIISHPEIEIHFLHEVNGNSYSLKSNEIRNNFKGDLPNSPEFIKYVRNYIEERLSLIWRKE